MSDLSELIGGVKGQQQPAGQESQSSGDGKVIPEKKKRETPKPDWVKHREEVTGQTASFNEAERRWIFPELSSMMGGPSKPKDKYANAFKAYTSGDYQKSYDIMSELMKLPEGQQNENWKKLFVRAQVALNIK